MHVLFVDGMQSLCYQLPAVILGGTTIVISPLLALMKDQVQTLTEKGIEAAAISSNNTEKYNKDIMERLLGRSVQTKKKAIGCLKPITLLYVTPEQVQTYRFRDLLKELHTENKLTMFVVDEAVSFSPLLSQFWT
jgi:ATP-dependent DNA helicase RecQ